MISPLLLLLGRLALTFHQGHAPSPGVALAENETRLETNPALLGSDSLDRGFHFRLSSSTRLPATAWSVLGPHWNTLSHRSGDAILADQELLDDLWRLDGQPVSIGHGYGLAFWKDDWAISSALETHPGIRMDHGVIIPTMDIWDSTETHFRAALSQPFGSFRVGTGVHLRGQTGRLTRLTFSDPKLVGRSVRSLRDSVQEHILRGWHYAAGLDLGLLCRLPLDLQLGARLGDVGMRDMDSDFERPILDLGGAWIPSRFHSGPSWARRLAVGAQWRDAFATDRPALGHLDFGMEVRQNLTKRGVEVRTSTGVRGGWPWGGLGFTLGPVRLDGFAWVEDLDRVLGRTPLRSWDLHAQFGW